MAEKIYTVLFLASIIGHTAHGAGILWQYRDRANDTKPKLFRTPNLWSNAKSFVETDSFLINTPGCYVPNYISKFKFDNVKVDEPTENRCGIRAVFAETGANNKVYFRIDEKAMKKYTVRTKYRCCYRFAYNTIIENSNQTEVVLTKCKTFKSGTIAPLEHEVITVSCTPPKQKKKELYTDAYIKIKKSNVSGAYNRTHRPWNVILLGMHSMSRARIMDTMPLTTGYFQAHEWLDFRGYQKIGSSTFPNLMAVLTGKNFTTISKNCEHGLYKCTEYFIWNKFMSTGYMTAFGEDYLNLPNTFSKYGGFRIKPTHHYMDPFYQLGEKRAGNIMCLKRQPSATHMLNYIHEFTQAYRKNKYFGMFWINSYSHDAKDNPSNFDSELSSWFVKMNNSGVFRNTFIIFFSDHGIRFGDMKVPIESYYEERLPMLYIWVPPTFKKQHSQKFTNMVVNEHRLVTPYDLYITLGDILRFSNSSVERSTSQACPRCGGLFRLKSIRWTCADARVSENGCSCRTMNSVDNGASETQYSLQLATDFINNVTENVSTAPCTACKQLKLKNILRSHAFHIKDRTYNVIAFEMSNNYRFEATVVYHETNSRILYLHTITAYSKKGNCVLDPSDRPYCDCDEAECDDDNDIDGNKIEKNNTVDVVEVL